MSERNSLANIETLIELRNQGHRPALQFVLFGSGGRLRGTEVGVADTANIEILDLRPFVELDVMVTAEHYSPSVLRLCERLNEYAATTTLTVINWLPDDLGFVWSKGSRKPRALGTTGQLSETAA